MSHDDDVVTLGAELAALVPALEPQEPKRFSVIRTSYTEEREPISKEDRIAVYARDHFRCVWCGKSEPLTLDHVVPWSNGGSDSINNLRTLCGPCNERRSNFAYEADLLWNPLPFGFACYNCCKPNDFDGPVQPMFCYWCRKAAVGWAAAHA
jgi:hypothetical protein